MSAQTVLFSFAAVKAPAARRQAVRCRAAAKEATPAKAEEFKCPLVCDALEKADAPVNEMAKAKCVHPDRAVAKACKDCPRR